VVFVNQSIEKPFWGCYRSRKKIVKRWRKKEKGLHRGEKKRPVDRGTRRPSEKRKCLKVWESEGKTPKGGNDAGEGEKTKESREKCRKENKTKAGTAGACSKWKLGAKGKTSQNNRTGGRRKTEFN